MEFREDLIGLFEQLRQGAVDPEVAQVVGLDELTEAHRRLEEGGLNGKLVLDPWHA